MIDERARKRALQVDELIDQLAIDEFEAFHGPVQLASVCIVIAAYHERDNIGAVVSAMPRDLCGLSADVLVVIDGDDDGASKIARDHNAYVLIAPVNRGQGAALRLGYRVAKSHGVRYLITADADGQTSPHDLEVCLAPVVSGEVDFVNGSRRLGHTHVQDLTRNVGVVVFSQMISRLTGTRVTDPANPVRAMRASMLDLIVLEEPQYQASELLISTIMSGARFSERPVTMRTRTSGHSKKGNNFAYGRRYARVLIRTYLRERRSRDPKHATTS